MGEIHNMHLGKRKRATQRRSPGNGIEFGDLCTGGRITLNR